MNSPIDSWGDSWGEDNDKLSLEYVKPIPWSNDYFKKINKLLDCNLFDLYLDYDTFIKKYDIEDYLATFLINNIKYYNSHFSIQLDVKEISMYSICLANIPIDETFNQRLDIYLKHDWNYNNILLIFLNIIDSDNLDLFKRVYDKYPNIIDTNNKIIGYSTINYNIVNHSLLCSKSIVEYICNYIDIFKYIIKHVELNLYINKSYGFLNILCNNIVKFNYNCKTQKLVCISHYGLSTFMEKCIVKNQSNYNIFIELFILKINDIEMITEYLALCIKNINIKLLNNYFEKRHFILKDVNYNSLLHFLVEMFNQANTYNNSIQNDIIKIWNLIFPYVQKYSLDYISDFFDSNNINNLVSFKKSVSIIKQIAPYISDWNKVDFCHYTPILDAIRYSKFETVSYMNMNYDIDLNIISRDNNTILSCAMLNSDLRVIDYIYKIILNDQNLFNIINNINDVCHIIRIFRINELSFKDIKKKIDILILLFGEQYIFKVVYNFIHYKPFIKYVIEKYNYKLDFNNYCYNPTRNLFNCSNLNKEYLKLVIDNIDYNKLNTKRIVWYFSTIGCIDLLIEMFEYMLSKNKLKKIDNSKYVYTNIFLKVYDNLKKNNCTKCKHKNARETFIKYINFIKINFIETYGIFINELYSNLSDYDDICDILFKNGIYFVSFPPMYDNIINNINSMCFIKLINLKRKLLSDENTKYSLSFLNWSIVICKLKMFVRKRFNKSKQCFISKITNVNDDINFSSFSINKLPSHLTPLDCFKPLHETHKFISMKADGVYKKGLFDVYPNINLVEDLEYEYEYEFIKDENMCYIFDNYDIIINLRNENSYIPNKIYPYLNLYNYKDVLLEYNELEKTAIKKFINSSNYKKKWWAKYVFKIQDMCHHDYLKLLDGISQLELDCIDNDGWILYGKDCMYKIKPQKLLTIDLIYKFNKLYDKQNNCYEFIHRLTDKELINNTIYRCYYNNGWEPREIRYDKFIPNDEKLCKFLEQSHKLPWSINNIKLVNSYYQKSSINNRITHKLSIDVSNKRVLDLGCGYSKKYVGIDIDPKVLNHQKSGEIYICDLTKDWCLEEQIKKYNNIYYYLPNINDFRTKYNNYKFEVILSNNSIHYLLNSNHEILFHNINKYTQKNSLFIIKFLDKELLDLVLNKKQYISNGSSFVRIYDKSKIKIYYDWVHNEPIIETTYTKNDLETIYNKYGWKLKIYNTNNLNKDMTNWDNYFRCFSTITFVKIS